MSYQPALSTIFLNTLSSLKLALVLVALLILFSLAGAVLPQQGKLQPGDIKLWQETHPIVTSIFKPAGLFHVFHSWPFLATIFLLTINTLTCTTLHFYTEFKSFGLKLLGKIDKLGFYLLHLSFILLFAGGFCSSAVRLDGFIVLTEGQGFTENHQGYLQLVEGPLRKEKHSNFKAILNSVQTKYERTQYQVDMSSSLTFLSDEKKKTEGIVKINEPFKYKGLTFTLRETGFSPKLSISQKKSKKNMIDSFVALKTFRQGQGREYRDFLPLPFLENRVTVTLYPDHSQDKDKIIKIAEVAENPILLMEVEDESGSITERKYLAKGKSVAIGKHLFNFKDLRQWAAFRVIDDPGYPIVWCSLWLGLAALILRYVPDLCRWFKEKDYSGQE